MFQFAFGISLLRQGFEVNYDNNSYIAKYEHEKIKLHEIFKNIDLKIYDKKVPSIFFLNSKHNSLNTFYFNLKLFYSKLLKKKYIFEKEYGYNENILPDKEKDTIYIGHWQSEKYFENIREDIKFQFQFPDFTKSQNIEIAEEISKENSVAIHIRKGKDYQFAPNICNKEYYERAIIYMINKIENPIFYVFTDNKDWARNNLKDFKYTLVTNNNINGEDSFRDMQLMSLAKNNIIANSSYSWWSAWLNNFKDKIVISPSIFFNRINKFYATSDVICSNWVKL